MSFDRGTRIIVPSAGVQVECQPSDLSNSAAAFVFQIVSSRLEYANSRNVHSGPENPAFAIIAMAHGQQAAAGLPFGRKKVGVLYGHRA